MIDQSLKIKLNQFMLAYERQCAELEFQRQNIKQNVMLSIIEMKNAKKVNSPINNSQLQKSVIKQKLNQNLASSKQTKFSEVKQVDNNNHEIEQNQNVFSEMQRSKFVPTNSKYLQKSNITVKSNKSSKLNNNYLNKQDFEDQQKLAQGPMQKSRKSGMFNNPYCFTKDKDVQVTDINGQQKDDNLITFNQRKSMLNKSPKNIDNKSTISKVSNYSQVRQPEQSENLAQSSISKRNPRVNQSQIQKQLDQNYSAASQSNVFQKNTRIYANSQKAIKPNPSLVALEDEQQNQEPEYPTFKRPSFQFITDMQGLRQSNSNQDEQNNQQDPYQQEEQVNPKSQTYGKWNSKRAQDFEEIQPQEEQNNNFEQQKPEIGQPQNFSNMQEDQSMMVASQLNQKAEIRTNQQRKSYLAFQINMEKSNLPSTEAIEQLKKKKILQLQRKRQQRMQNHSRKKQNASQISNNSKQQKKQHSNVFIGNRNPSKRENDNRDSLNKSINEKKSERPKPLKNSNFRQDQSCKDSVFQDNKTIMTKYGEDSKINNRSTSPINTPLNTVKTIQTDKRPPLNKNRKDDNIFAGESTFQRQRSSQKLSADPKIVPIDRKNSFQKKSNIKIMVNAITYTCLPGELNRRQRQKLIDVLQDYENEYFIFLFKEYSRKVIKGIYMMDGNQQRMLRIYGDKGPSQIYPQQVHEFYRFDSGSREFKKIDGCKSFSFSIHAIDLK